ncbi:MAG: 50S ribosomal protein L4 [Anaerolineae bacterium]
MKVPVLNMTGKEIKKIDLPADIFEVEVNTGLMHQAYVRQMANARLGTAKVQRRGEVNRTSAKWYRQKGTGRARHGSRDATQFVGGGRPKGPVPHKYTKDMPRKMRQQAIRCALSALLRDNQLVFVDALKLDAPKTKEMRQILDAVAGKDSKTLVVVAQGHDNVVNSIHNLDKTHVILANYLNMRDLLQADRVIVPLDALEVIKSLWGQA